ncbi:SixA phosphatase family protein [Roseateles amylovorans]|uniref:Histidine phosphatase family protein n=1 Tax=Roseateles amylovorans TaxID=2978473 RepID=A0ABY6B5Z1_9BURK|nr:histidine phosphatase family protein [Roseateles amylovorans]UXH80267.1 histidine phosphatase family protein [Roseateles amylovorans]
MDLILWRHAEAVDAAPGMDDMSRVLTTQGERHAERVAQWLNERLPSEVKVLVSPAVRTRQTVQALRRRVELCDALAPRQGVQAMLQATGWPDAPQPVLVVGHQPSLGMALAHLVGGQPLAQAMPWRVRKAGLWWLRCERRPHERVGVVVLAVRTPELQ